MNRHHSRTAFGLVDLLVIIAIIATLVSLLMPAILAGSEAADRSKCSENLRQLGLGIQKYALAHQDQIVRGYEIHYPNPYGFTNPKYPGMDGGVKNIGEGGWTILVLPYIDQEELYRRIDKSKYWLSTPAGVEAAKAVLPGFMCPSGLHYLRSVSIKDMHIPNGSTSGGLDYRGASAAEYLSNVFDPEHHFPGAMEPATAKPTRFRDVRDGTSNTLLLFEQVDAPYSWRAGKLTTTEANPTGTGWGAFTRGQSNVRSTSHDGVTNFGDCAVNCNNGSHPYSFHPGGANVLMCDGAVRFLSADLSPAILVAIVSTQGGEVLSESDY